MAGESKFQTKFIKRLRRTFPGCYVLKNNAGYIQGVPDWIVLYKDKWAMLEMKASMPTCASDYEPNQEWYIEQFNDMSFAAMVCPENEEEIMDALQSQFSVRREARVS